MNKLLTTLWALCALCTTFAQSLPSQWLLLESQHQIQIGGIDDQGLYDNSIIREYYLQFDQSNYWSVLTNNYGTDNEVQATLTVDGVSYPQVGVSFKGQTSYMMVQGQKKSFSIKMDSFIADQDLMGYKTINLNNCFGDASFLREFLYLNLIRNHIPAAKACFVHLFINGEDWGLYPSIQQMNKDYLEEWFLSNDGDNWRADAPSGTTGGGPGGGGPGGGPQWGDGTAALNYNGANASDYNTYYTLKSQGIDEPWQHLIHACDVLENTPIAQLENELPAAIDVDRALWFLACEIAFGDDDSYIYKGKMDYYAYWEAETGRLTPLEYDGNSILGNQANSWGPFYHADNVNYPLMSRLMQVPAYRQRYLAHLRTIIDDLLNLTQTQSLIDEYSAFINALVQSDPKKLTTYAQFQSELSVLQQRLTTRRNTLLANSEVNTTGPNISGVGLYTENQLWQLPEANQSPMVKASVTSSDPIAGVNLYYASGLVGAYSTIPMSLVNGVYEAVLPTQLPGTVVRFYIEAIEANTAGTRSYEPVGAEHDFYYYYVLASIAPETNVVINELMASNGGVATDEFGESDDWIELFNLTDQVQDLSGYYLTDNAWNLQKWTFPQGSIIAPNDYLMVWADEDQLQGELHTNFKMSASGESLLLLNPQGLIVDQISFGQQEQNMGFARNPNGTGDFVIQAATFNANNNTVVGVKELEQKNEVTFYPNPSENEIYVIINAETSQWMELKWYSMDGRCVQSEHLQGIAGQYKIAIDISQLSRGPYVVHWVNETSAGAATIVKK